MPPTEPTPAPKPEEKPAKKPRKSPQIIDLRIQDHIAIAEACFTIPGEDPAIMTALVDREWEGHSALGQSLVRCHGYIGDITGKRLAKRDEAETLRSLRDRGESPAGIRERLGFSF